MLRLSKRKKSIGPPDTIFVSCQTPGGSLESATDYDDDSLGSSAKTTKKQRCRVRVRKFNYMETPSSMTSPLRPIFPWEIPAEDNEGRPITPSSTASSSRHRKPSHNRHQPKNAFMQRPFLAVVCLITLALAAGTLLDGDNSRSAFAKGRQRGKHLPPATSKQEGIGQDMYKAYKELQQDYHSKAFHDENSEKWRLLTEKGGAKVSMLEHTSDPTCPYVRMEAVIPTSVADCWEFLGIHNWHWSMPKMDPFYDTHDTLQNITHEGVNMILVRKKTHRILAFGKRDFVFLSVSDLPLEDGTCVSGSVSVETPDVPRESGYTRAFQDSIAFYKPVKTAEGTEQCHLTIVCRIDLNDHDAEQGQGGFVPMWIYVKTVGATGLKSLFKMRDALIEMKKEAEARLPQAASSTTEESTPSTDATGIVSSSATSAPMPSSPSLSTAQPPTPAKAVPLDSETVEEECTTSLETGQSVEVKRTSWWNRSRGGAFGTSSTTNVDDSPWKPLLGPAAHMSTAGIPASNKRGWGLKSGIPWSRR